MVAANNNTTIVNPKPQVNMALLKQKLEEAKALQQKMLLEKVREYHLATALVIGSPALLNSSTHATCLACQYSS